LGAEGLFCETHPDPDRSPSDGANMVPLAEFAEMLRRLVEVRDTVRRFAAQPAEPSINR
jgi:2-dehydro-3-deoxyphosphooctonate aldolase (KDO 8-P synthase)